MNGQTYTETMKYSSVLTDKYTYETDEFMVNSSMKTRGI
jgi:hypothetical protein